MENIYIWAQVFISFSNCVFLLTLSPRGLAMISEQNILSIICFLIHICASIKYPFKISFLHQGHLNSSAHTDHFIIRFLLVLVFCVTLICTCFHVIFACVVISFHLHFVPLLYCKFSENEDNVFNFILHISMTSSREFHLKRHSIK